MYNIDAYFVMFCAGRPVRPFEKKNPIKDSISTQSGRFKKLLYVMRNIDLPIDGSL